MTTGSVPYQVPRDRYGPVAIAVAIAMHGLLAALLVFGLRWTSQTPTVIEAELWRALPETAAPAPDPAPAAAPEPAPAPVPKVVPRAEPEPPKKPDIATRREPEKKKVETKKTEPKKVEPPKPDPRKAEPKKVEAKKVEAKKADPRSTGEAVTPRPEEPRAPSELQNLLADAAKASSGTAARTAGPVGDKSYVSAIQARILSNLRFPVPADLVGNPEAVFVIEQLPTGEIRSVIKRKASGLPAFDAAVERAINASSPLPRAADGRVERSIELVFRPRDRG